MKLPNRPGRLNRAVLFCLGLTLLAAGAFVLATGSGAIGLVPRQQSLAFVPARPPQWAAYAALAAAVVVGLAALRWLAAQARRRPRTEHWRIAAHPDRGVTTLHADSAAAPLVADVETYEGVRSAAAWLTGSRLNPALQLRVRTDDHADLNALRRRIHGHALPRLCAALELDGLPCVILIAPTTATVRAR